jgi:hypothetical protein
MSKSIALELQKSAKITYIKEPNRIESVTKQKDGSIEFKQKSGNVISISKDDKELQAFMIYSILTEL